MCPWIRNEFWIIDEIDLVLGRQTTFRCNRDDIAIEKSIVSLCFHLKNR